MKLDGKWRLGIGGKGVLRSEVGRVGDARIAAEPQGPYLGLWPKVGLEAHLGLRGPNRPYVEDTGPAGPRPGGRQSRRL